MSETFALKPTHKAVSAYYLALAQLANVGAAHHYTVEENPAGGMSAVQSGL